MFRNHILSIPVALATCANSYAYDVPDMPTCVIDRCEGKLCVVETPEGTVHIPRKQHYYEGMPLVCPLWLIEPT